MVGLSVGFYALGVWTVRHSDSRNGYPKRDFLWAGSERYDEVGTAKKFCTIVTVLVSAAVALEA